MERTPGDNNRPEHERLEPWEIDLTGSTEQDDSLRDVIGDAIHEATAAGGEVPEWGARTIARALANRLPDATSALHTFAVTGTGDQARLSAELADLYGSGDAEVREWVNWLGTYLIKPSREPGSAEPDAPLTATSSANSPEKALPEQAAEGLREHGDAFRAYLQLPDIQADRDDLAEAFHEFYVGSFPTMDALLDQLTEVRDWEHALSELAGHWGIDGLVSLDRRKVEQIARETWDIVELNGRFYAFNK